MCDKNIWNMPMGVCAFCNQPFGNCKCRPSTSETKPIEVLNDAADPVEARTELEKLQAENVLLREALQNMQGCFDNPIARRSFNSISFKAVASAEQAFILTPETAKIQAVLDAAIGICRGEDWNNGTQAKTHGYKQKLKDAVRAWEEE